jgi:hypothetical protein
LISALAVHISRYLLRALQRDRLVADRDRPVKHIVDHDRIRLTRAGCQIHDLERRPASTDRRTDSFRVWVAVDIVRKLNA